MQVSRAGHTATPLNNGVVLVAGGAGGDARIEEFSLSGVFQVAGTMTVARTDHTATLLTDGRVLLLGGADGNGGTWSSAEIFDPTTGMSSATSGSMQTPRSKQRATLLLDGRVLVTGGLDANGTPLASAEVFDPASGRFSPASDMQIQRTNHSATLLRDGRVLIAGGADYSTHQACSVSSCWDVTWRDGDPRAELYDPATETFANTGSMQVGRFDHTATLLSDGRVLILAGAVNDDYQGTGPYGSPRGVWNNTADAELYDPLTGTFGAAGTLQTSRAAHSATLLDDGQVFVAGGAIYGPYLSAYNTTELYDPVIATAIFGPTLSTARYRHTASLLGIQAVLLTGGTDNTADLYWPPGVPVTLGYEKVASFSLSWGYIWNGYQGGPCNSNWYTSGVTFGNDFYLYQINVPNHNNGYSGNFYVYRDTPTSLYASTTSAIVNFGDGVAQFFFGAPLIQAGHIYFFDGDHVGPPGNDFSTGGYMNCGPSTWDFYSAPPPPTGTISVSTNLAASTFTITGPATFSGAGTTATFPNAPTGDYTITFGAVAGYVTPQPQSKTLSAGNTLVFSGQYNPAISQARGYDMICVATTEEMKIWWEYSPYYDTGVYLGGCNVSCLRPPKEKSDPCATKTHPPRAKSKPENTNLTKDWINEVSGMDGASKMAWGIMPLWVGPQAPCNDRCHDPKKCPYWLIGNDPAAEGKAEAHLAVQVANELGITNAIIYYDMESYDRTDTSCRNVVSKFVNAWVQEMHSSSNGFLSGVYGEAGNGKDDWYYLDNRPDDVWIHRTDGVPSTLNLPPLDSTQWVDHQRTHQYCAGPAKPNSCPAKLTETWGAVTLGQPPNQGIDRDVEDARVVSWFGYRNLAAPLLLLPSNGSILVQLPITFSWASVDGATSGYRIMVATDPSFLPTDPTVSSCPECVIDYPPADNANRLNDTTYTAGPGQLQSGKTYYWQVNARGEKYGAWSAQFSFTSSP